MCLNFTRDSGASSAEPTKTKEDGTGEESAKEGGVGRWIARGCAWVVRDDDDRNESRESSQAPGVSADTSQVPVWSRPGHGTVPDWTPGAESGRRVTSSVVSRVVSLRARLQRRQRRRQPTAASAAPLPPTRQLSRRAFFFLGAEFRLNEILFFFSLARVQTKLEIVGVCSDASSTRFGVADRNLGSAISYPSNASQKFFSMFSRGPWLLRIHFEKYN